MYAVETSLKNFVAKLSAKKEEKLKTKETWDKDQEEEDRKGVEYDQSKTKTQTSKRAYEKVSTEIVELQDELCQQLGYSFLPSFDDYRKENKAVAKKAKQLHTQNKELTADNNKLTSDNTKLTSDNTKLTAEKTRLTADKLQLIANYATLAKINAEQWK